jgi:hypothetical protein
VVQYSIRHYSELIGVYSKNVTSCIIGKWWPISVLIKKCAHFATVFVILFRPIERKRKKGRKNARKNGKEKCRKRREIPSSRRLF